MLIKEAKSLKKINLPKYCSDCGVSRSKYWHAILSSETPTRVEMHEDDDNKMPEMSGYKNYILCDKCSKKYNKMSIAEQNYRRGNFGYIGVESKETSFGEIYVKQK
jgi:hypothetical protein